MFLQSGARSERDKHMPVIRLADYKSRNKYRNRWTEYHGVRYQSKREATFAMELDLAFGLKQVKDWRRQVEVPLVVNGKRICKLVVDFEVRYPDGTTEFIEVKGRPTRDWRLKWKLFEALYPDAKKRIIK